MYRTDARTSLIVYLRLNPATSRFQWALVRRVGTADTVLSWHETADAAHAAAKEAGR